MSTRRVRNSDRYIEMLVNILEPDDYSQTAVATYRKLGEVITGACQADETSVNILVVRLSHRLDSSFLALYPALVAIASPTTGLNHICFRDRKTGHALLTILLGRRQRQYSDRLYSQRPVMREKRAHRTSRLFPPSCPSVHTHCSSLQKFHSGRCRHRPV